MHPLIILTTELTSDLRPRMATHWSHRAHPRLILSFTQAHILFSRDTSTLCMSPICAERTLYSEGLVGYAVFDTQCKEISQALDSVPRRRLATGASSRRAVCEAGSGRIPGKGVELLSTEKRRRACRYTEHTTVNSPSDWHLARQKMPPQILGKSVIVSVEAMKTLSIRGSPR